jgi:hypothetical protein
LSHELRYCECGSMLVFPQILILIVVLKSHLKFRWEKSDCHCYHLAVAKSGGF